MWHTSTGTRTLTKPQARMFLECVDWIIQRLFVTSEPFKSDVYLFDAMPVTKKIGALFTVTTSLVKLEYSAPPLSSVLEATIASVFVAAKQSVAIELQYNLLGDEHPKCMTKIIYDVLVSMYDFDGTFDYPKFPEGPYDPNADWEYWIEQIEGTILWDDQYDLLSLAEQKAYKENPTNGKFLSIRGIDTYFVERMREICQREAESKLDTLFEILGKKTTGRQFMQEAGKGIAI